MLEIIGQLNNKNVDITKLIITEHMKHRLYRINFNNEYLNNKNIYKSYLVNTNHKNGKEIHIILKNATILILNNKTKKLITILNARKGQLIRYDKKTPNFMLKLAHRNEVEKRNK